MITLVIFDYWEHKAIPKLRGHESMSQHLIEESGESLEKRKRRIQKMLSINSHLICTFSRLHAADGLKHVFNGDGVIVAITRFHVTLTVIGILHHKLSLELFHLLCIVRLRIALETIFKNICNISWYISRCE